jgi:holo-[acyl-carrier protein] synthase
MKIFGVGVDIVEVNRIKSAVGRLPGFLKKVYTDNEINFCESKNSIKFICYAERFAAKEAVAKSLKSGFGRNMSFNEIEVVNTISGEPVINLYGETQKYFSSLGASEIKISLSGTKKYAVAFATSIM